MPSTTRKTKATRADRKAEIEVRLKESIEGLIAGGESFTELSIDRIVAEAGMARSTFYVYFADKGSLLSDLAASALHELYDGASDWLHKKDAVSYEDVRAAIRAVLEAFRDEEVVMAAVAETSVYDAEVREMYRRGVEDYIERVRKMIVRGQKDGSIRLDLPPAETAAAISWMLERTTLLLAPGATDRRLDEIAEGIARTIWGALYVAA